MSSSSTDTTLVDVAMPQMGVSVAEGTDRRVAQAGRRLGRGRRDHRLDLDRQDRHRRPVAGHRPRAARSSSRSARRSTSAPCWRGSRPTPSPGEAHASEQNGAPRARARPRRAERAGERRRSCRATPPSRTPGTAAARRAARARAQRRRAATRRSSMRIAAEHDVDLEQVEGTGRGGRVRKQDVLAYIESDGGAAAATSRRCTSSRPTGPTSPRRAAQAEVGGSGRARPRPRRRPAAGRACRPAAAARCRACASRSAAHMMRSLETAATCTTSSRSTCRASSARARELG